MMIFLCQNFKREPQVTLAPLHVIKFKVCSYNIASLRAGESTSSVREPQVTEAVTWGSLLKC